MDDFDDIQCEEIYGEEWDGDEEPFYSDFSDDAEVLASAGMGTDEDYGGTIDDWMED